MIRRLAVGLALVFVLGACGSSDDEFLQIRDVTVSEEDFLATFEVTQGPEFESSGTISGDDARRWAFFVSDAYAALQALEAFDVPTDEARLATGGVLRDAVASGQFNAVEEGTPEWDMLVDVFSLNSVQVLPTVPVSELEDLYFEIRTEIEVSPRLGTYNPDTSTIEPPS